MVVASVIAYEKDGVRVEGERMLFSEETLSAKADKKMKIYQKFQT